MRQAGQRRERGGASEKAGGAAKSGSRAPGGAAQGESRAQTFGETLRDTRRAGGVSQDELARASGVDRSAISNYERGLREPNLRTIIKLADALGVHPAALLQGL